MTKFVTDDLQIKARNWLETAIAYWCGRGFDYETGLFRESLDFNGADGRLGYLRCRVQARQLYVFAQAKGRGYDVPDMVLEAGYLALETHFAHADGGYMTLVNSDGSARDLGRTFYDQAFVLLALGALYGLTKAPHVLARAKELLDFLNANMAHLAGGYVEILPDDSLDSVDDNADENAADSVDAPRYQNPHMHFFEACVVLHKVSGEGIFLTHAEKILQLLEDKFVADTGQLYELFTQNLAPLDEAHGQIIEAGHSFEWVYLLSDYGVSVTDAGSVGARLMAFACANGLDKNALYGLDVVGKNTRRLWVQAELLRARMIFPAQDAACSLLGENIFSDYLNTDERGLWYDKFTLNGALKARDVPASTFYHLWDALNLLAKCQRQMKHEYQRKKPEKDRS